MMERMHWWQQLCYGVFPDCGLHDLTIAAKALEISRLCNALDNSWRQEWTEARAEQLQLQGEAHLATHERLSPGR